MSPGDRVQVLSARAQALIGSDVAEVLAVGDGEAQLKGPDGTCWEDTDKLRVYQGPIRERLEQVAHFCGDPRCDCHIPEGG